MITRRSALTVILIAVLASVLTDAGAKAATSPGEAAKFLQALGDRALAILRSKDTTLEEREAEVREVLSRSFDLKTIGRFVLGSAWRRATPVQRDDYQRLFEEFLLQTYTRRLGGYAGESFRVLEAKSLGKRDALVVTEIRRAIDAPALQAGWRVRGGPAGHKIIDVIVEGVSMILAQRSEFKSIVQRDGLGGLIEMLRLKVAKYSVRAS